MIATCKIRIQKCIKLLDTGVPENPPHYILHTPKGTVVRIQLENGRCGEMLNQPPVGLYSFAGPNRHTVLGGR